MDLSARRQPPTVRLRRLASELRGLRTTAGLTREEVSDQTGINPATLYRIETAKVRPQRRTLMALLDTYGVTDEARRSELIALSRQATQLGWLQQFESELPEQYTTYISFEGDARSIRNYESLFVPGLLQTEEYARAIIKGVLPFASDDEVEHRVEARLQRQEVLRKKHPLRLWAILDEAVLHRRVGGTTVMVKQLQALVTAANQPHITLQVIPFSSGAHTGMLGSFVVMDFPDPADPDLVYIDSMAGDLFLERAPDLRRFTMLFDHLQALALDPSGSVRMIEAQADAIT
ncbi:helix-turn-helix domain-containing protein [Planosporangium flavigriseum]|uniref:Transcriptional regulator n=1 Tax=Planosporangium flavigriseum TaxID=373681 RepID=A0A8J3M1V1_9ACTN|nr:helix-turn-helix transcriptional regulator [Planosporangium flavigriseum]NJC66127.1 helix-turn-helix domain-containing protein [Planosporangium flavigriseum]GIG75180.1 transcriptional regulator [Planosporangium flavigriseum]